MISRKKKILFIQIVLFLFASSLLYITYNDKKKYDEDVTEVKAKSEPNTNSFEDVEYTGLDLNGNRYAINAKKANFKTEKPELIMMEGMVAYFYFKDNTELKVVGDKGNYNNKTYDMEFRENVRADYISNFVLSDKLTYSNDTSTYVPGANATRPFIWGSASSSLTGGYITGGYTNPSDMRSDMILLTYANDTMSALPSSANMTRNGMKDACGISARMFGFGATVAVPSPNLI